MVLDGKDVYDYDFYPGKTGLCHGLDYTREINEKGEQIVNNVQKLYFCLENPCQCSCFGAKVKYKLDRT